jgi:HSP20 family molecular chaperone IbpA
MMPCKVRKEGAEIEYKDGVLKMIMPEIIEKY